MPEEDTMRMLMKVRLPVETANEFAANGTLGRTIGSIVKQTKPLFAFFGEEDGMRTGFLVVELEGMHKIPQVCEPWFLAFNAKISLVPVMTTDDLEKAAPDFEKAAREYGRKEALAHA
jgi:hypothetical protein